MELEKKRTGVELKLYELTENIVKENELELYDAEYISGSSTLRVFVMDPATNSAVIEDCIKVDRAFNPYCETEEWIPNDFVLEVSSPGVYRSLKTLKHFESAVGDIIACTISGNLTPDQSANLDKGLKNSKKFRGILVDVKETEINIDLQGTNLNLAFEQIKKASLDPDLNR
jgi:ribosome maturation factor RimP